MASPALMRASEISFESDFDAGERADLGDPRAHLAGPDRTPILFMSILFAHNGNQAGEYS